MLIVSKKASSSISQAQPNKQLRFVQSFFYLNYSNPMLAQLDCVFIVPSFLFVLYVLYV